MCPRGFCYTYVLVDILDLVIEFFFQIGVSALLMLHVYVLVYVLDFVIVLFRSGVFEYILFCNRVVFSIRVRFG